MNLKESTEKETKSQFVTLNQTHLTQVTGGMGMYKQEMVGARTRPVNDVMDMPITTNIDRSSP